MVDDSNNTLFQNPMGSIDEATSICTVHPVQLDSIPIKAGNDNTDSVLDIGFSVALSDDDTSLDNDPKLIMLLPSILKIFMERSLGMLQFLAIQY